MEASRILVTAVRGNHILYQGFDWPLYDCSKIKKTGIAGTYTAGKFTPVGESCEMDCTTIYVYTMEIPNA